MRALRFELTIPRYLLGVSAGKLTDWAIFGPPSGLSLAELPVPRLPAGDWARLEVVSCGICGTDLATLNFKNSPALEPFASFPAVLGHEILARVVEVGPAVTRVKVGDRVAVDPILSCEARGRKGAEACPSCAVGLPYTCDHQAEAGGPSPGEGPLARGFTLGANSDLPGGFGEQLVAHQNQLHVVPEWLDDAVAGLTEPLAVAVHAVLRAGADPDRPVLVIGSGPIALSTVWAVRAAGHRGPLVAQVKRQNEAALARELGASATASPGEEARAGLLATGARAYKPIIGPEVYAGGGYAAVFDCVGTRESVDQSLRFVAPRGRVVMLGCASQVSNLDLSFVWSRELLVQGFLAYGREAWRGEALHTYEVTWRLLQESKAPVGKLLTHTFPLSQYRQALAAAAHRRESGALKVRLVPS